MSHSDSLIQLFCKTPRLGEVKTRLVPVLGEAGALALYKELVSDTVDRIRQSGLPNELWFSPEDHPFFTERATHRFAQRGADLGERMQSALADGLRRSESVILIGADVPLIDGAYLRQAAVALRDHDVVLGPAEDGGYGLVGVAGAVPDIFTGISWSTSHVLSDTCRLLNAQRINYALLPLVWDVDRPEDLDRFRLLKTA